jgi:hypothetical protein
MQCHAPPRSVGTGIGTSILAGTPVAVDGGTISLARVHPLDGLPMPLRTLALPLLPTRSLPNLRLFRPAQPPRACQSVLYAWPQTLTTPGGASPTHYGTDPKPGAERAKREGSSLQLAQPCAAIGTAGEVVPPMRMGSGTSAPGVETRIMELRGALEHRRRQALTPYKAEAWELLLRRYNLSVKYPNLSHSLRVGFDAGIQPIYLTSTPPNSPTLLLHPQAYQEMVTKEFSKGRYIGPCTRQEVEELIGPFQSSALSWVPKPGKPGKYRAVHNFSYPHTPTPTAISINCSIDADMFPCTWGTFSTICFTIFNLPPGSQAAIRDVAEAYRTIPITPDQWPGLVVKLVNDDEFAINTCNNFGLTSAGGIYGELGDATLDIFRAQGMGPISRWVDDHIFFRIPAEHRAAYNISRQRWHSIIMQNGGRLQSGSRFWYPGESMPDDLPAEFDEDAASPIADHSLLLNRTPYDALFTYCDYDIDLISGQLGIPWEPSKTVPFSSVVPYLGFEWNIPERTVAITENKKAKYRSAIRGWLLHPTHNLEEAQKLYGKLLHACLVLPAGRAYLTSLESLMASFGTNPFVPHHAPRHTVSDLSWWLEALSSPSISRPIPGPAHVTDRAAFSDASSGVGIGIVIGNQWRAWRLIPGWKADGRDIGWAEAVGFELLARALSATSHPGQFFRVFGDNRGVVEGWWKGRSRNWETNKVFRRIHGLADTHQCTFITRYVTSRENPADAPSRGLYPPLAHLLPAISFPDSLRQFIVDFDQQPPLSRVPTQL